MLYQNIVILFGLLAIASTRNFNRDNVRDYDEFNIQDIQGLLKSIKERGIEEDNHSHHKRHHSKKQHDDDHNHMNIQALNLVFKHNNLRREKPAERLADLDHENKVGRIMCAITGSYGCSRSDDRDDLRASDDVSYDNKYKLDDDRLFEVQAKNDMELLLNDLEKKLLSKKGKEGSERDDQAKNIIRCSGNRCEILLNDRDDSDDEDQLRCKRCRDSYRAGNDDILRCGPCGGRGRASDDDDMTRGESGGRADDRRDDDRKDDDRRDDDDIIFDDRIALRCKGNRCGRGRSRNEDDIDTAFKSVLDNYGKRYKINNELDAIVLDVDNLDDVLEALSPNDKKSDDRDMIRNKIKRLTKDRQRALSLKYQDNKPLTLQSLEDENLLVLKGPLELENQSKVRSYFPMTQMQKLRLVRQKAEHDAKEKVQVPFVLEVQGLGQANAEPS